MTTNNREHASTGLYDRALAEIEVRLREQDPDKAEEFYRKVGAPALRGHNLRNCFYAVMPWSIEGDPFSAVILRANFPDEYIRERQGYLGVTFVRSGQDRQLELIYGGGDESVISMGARMTEPYASGKESGEADPAVAADILARFGIVAPDSHSRLHSAHSLL